MITRNSTLAAALTAALTALTAAVPAQIDRDYAGPVESHKLYNASHGTILGHAIQGFRPSNIEIAATSPIRFHGSVIKNTGAYARTWTLYFDKTYNELAIALFQNNQRPVDVERYTVGNQTYYAAIAFQNTGPAQKTWNWFSNVAAGSVLSTVQNVGGRIIDLEPYYDNGEWRYDVLSIANTGNDYKAWWVYTNTTAASVQTHMALHGSRVYDYEDQALFGNDAAVLVRDNVPSKTFFGPNNYTLSWNQHEVYGGRIIGISDFGISDEAVTIIDNLDPFAEFGASSQGTQGSTIHAGWGRALTGTQVDYTVANLRPWAPAALHLGFYQTNLPLDLLGAAGCSVYTLPEVVISKFSGPNGIATVELDLPNAPMLHGMTFVTQMLAIDPGANLLGVQTSNGIVTTVRHW